MKTTLYLHGFLSAPSSQKAQLLQESHRRAGMRFIAPDLTAPPLEAARRVLEAAAGIAPETLTVAGSSLGGFYAAWAAQRLGCRMVLLNPAVSPWEVVGRFTGAQTTVDGRRIEVTAQHARDLRQLSSEPVSDPHRCLVVLSGADEVLDWREADAKYRGSSRIWIPGGDHRISNFRQYCEAVTQFCAGIVPAEDAGARSPIFDQRDDDKHIL